MIHIKEAIVVEGKYDKAVLAPLVDTVILDTAGFGIFSDKEKLRLLKRLAEQRGLIILTDSDGGGFVIRNFLRSSIDPRFVKHAYIPDIYGKESRKRKPSKEGKLGVEGMSAETLLIALNRAGITIEDSDTLAKKPMFTKAEFFELGLTGCKDSAELRSRLKKRLDLPEKLTTNAMLDVLNIIVGREELYSMIRDIRNNWVT